MSYRVETASTGRAVCRATECKKQAIKIEKDELRMGTWVEVKDNASWHWRHWGCVTGHQLQNIRNNLADPQNPGVYRWDFLDGYEGDEKNSLDKHPELQDKVRRVITQGFIDPEDFNGDPEMNKLGEKGLYTSESKKKMKEDEKSRNREIAELQAQIAALTAERDDAIKNATSTKKVDVKLNLVKDELEIAEKKPRAAIKNEPDANSAQLNEKGGKMTKRKRSKKVKEEDEEGTGEENDDADYGKPAKKARTKKVKKEDSADEEDDDNYVKPTKKARARKVKKEEETDDDDDYAKPAKKSRSRNVKKEKEPETIKEEVDNTGAIVAPQKRAARGKKAVKDEIVDGQADATVSPEVEPKAPTKRAIKKEEIDESNGLDIAVQQPKTKTNGKKGNKKATKQESSETRPSTLKRTPSESPNLLADIDPAPETKAYGDGIMEGKRIAHEMAPAVGETEDDSESFIEKKSATASKTKNKGGKGKKAAAPKAAASQRSSRKKSK